METGEKCEDGSRIHVETVSLQMHACVRAWMPLWLGVTHDLARSAKLVRAIKSDLAYIHKHSRCARVCAREQPFVYVCSSRIWLRCCWSARTRGWRRHGSL